MFVVVLCLHNLAEEDRNETFYAKTGPVSIVWQNSIKHSVWNITVILSKRHGQSRVPFESYTGFSIKIGLGCGQEVPSPH